MHDPGPEGVPTATEGVRPMAKNMASLTERKTLCLGGAPGVTIHSGDERFLPSMRELYNTAENNAAESFVLLKQHLARLHGDDFWSLLTKELASICGAQYVLVAKRVLPHDVDSVVEMPEYGAPGSCFSAVSMYFKDGTREQETRGFEYPAQGSLCAHMKHDKVFLVPAHLADFMQERASIFEVPVESHFAVPFNDGNGRCFAHIGVFWSVTGEQARELTWGFIEMMLHALEDLAIGRLLQGRRHTHKEESKLRPPRPRPRPLINSLYSLKPYARSLSHELRTPMHGVVGMLDIMHATVQEALEAPADDAVAAVFRTLKENIEMIQDSSRRAVEAADNVVQAYDFNMEVPETEDTTEALAAVVEAETAAKAETAQSSPTKDNTPAPPKRRRSDSLDAAATGPSPKHRIIELPPRSATPNMATLTPHTAALRSIVKESSDITEADGFLVAKSAELPLTSGIHLNGLAKSEELPPPTPGTHFTRLREIIHIVVNESLRFGGRPDSAIATETPLGEQIEVRNRGSNGDASTKMVEWSVEPGVPDEILIDERDFAKLVSVLFLNALKFTEHGSVRLHVSLSPRSRFVVLHVTDTGMGIPAAFRPYLFKAFARGDDSLTRQNEGLGLGLMVAKSLARRVGGDLVCVRSDTRGPRRGSEFELRIPLAGASDASRSQTPSRTPTPVRGDRSLTPSLQEPVTSASSALEMSVPPNKPSTNQPRTGEPSPRTSPPAPQLVPQPTFGNTPAPRRLSQSVPYVFDRSLAQKVPLNLLVAEDNKINRKLLVNMLGKLGYSHVHEAFDGAEAVRLMEMDQLKPPDRHIDVILMDLWMPHMDGYEATRRILAMQEARCVAGHLKILAVTADVTDIALDRARAVGMHGIMTKPYKLVDLERLIVEYGPMTKVAS